MMDFKITPEDVGRIAIDCSNMEWRCVCQDGEDFVFERGGEYEAFEAGGGKITDPEDGFICWKPRTLRAAKRWWCVWRSTTRDEVEWDHFPACPHDVERIRTGAKLIAVIYDTHWHGHEEGTQQRLDKEAYDAACADAAFIAAANPKTVLELIARVEAAEDSNGELEREAQSHYNLYRAAMSELNRSCAALEQAKAREAELLGALEPFANQSQHYDGIKGDSVRTAIQVQLGWLRNAVTAMGGDDNG